MTDRVKELVDQRVALETKLQNEPGELSESRARDYERDYTGLQRHLAGIFKEATDDAQRTTIMLEMMRILENRLVYLQNFIVDSTSENRMLAQLVTGFIDQLTRDRSTVLTKLEATYYRAVAALYAGDIPTARAAFAEACASEESDEANDIKYKSYVMLGHLSHEERDYARAREMHDQSMRYSQNDNVTAQALALKALNCYALREFDEALKVFSEALQLFKPDQPFFNSYFYRNALLFCGGIYFDRRDYANAERYYGEVVKNVEQNSYDFFDALTHLGRIYYAQEKYDDAVSSFEKAVHTHRFSENEYLVDTWFWIARSYLKRNEPQQARTYLEKVAASDVKYDKKPQALQLLQKVS
jgi:tetratricopeptide (TPR) repeat protein